MDLPSGAEINGLIIEVLAPIDPVVTFEPLTLKSLIGNSLVGRPIISAITILTIIDYNNDPKIIDMVEYENANSIVDLRLMLLI